MGKRDIDVFEHANEIPLTLECRVIYTEQQDAAKLPESIRSRFYSIETSEHTAFFGQIVAAYVIDET